MESTISDLLKLIFSRTDPVLVAVLIVLAVLWYRTDQKISRHIDPQNKYPHPACEWGEKSYKELTKQFEKLHQENREDHQEVFSLLRGEKK